MTSTYFLDGHWSLCKKGPESGSDVPGQEFLYPVNQLISHAPQDMFAAGI